MLVIQFDCSQICLALFCFFFYKYVHVQEMQKDVTVVLHHRPTLKVGQDIYMLMQIKHTASKMWYICRDAWYGCFSADTNPTKLFFFFFLK